MLNQLPSHAGTSPTQIARTYAPNPDKLAARTHNPNIPPELVDLLAEDELNRKRKEARAAIDAKMGGPQPTVAEKLRSENEDGAREDVQKSLGIAGLPAQGMAPPQGMPPQGMPPQGMPPQGGLGALMQGQPQQPPMQGRPMPPQQGMPPQGQMRPPQGMPPPQGLMAAKSNLPGRYQQGGIVAFQSGELVPNLEQSAEAMADIGERGEDTTLPRAPNDPAPAPLRDDEVPESAASPEDEEAMKRILAITDPEKKRKAMQMFVASKRAAAAPPAAPPTAPASVPPPMPPGPQGIGTPPTPPGPRPPTPPPGRGIGVPPPGIKPNMQMGSALDTRLEREAINMLDADPEKAGMAAMAEEARIMGPGRAAMTGVLESQRPELQGLHAARAAQAVRHGTERQGGIDQLAKLQAAHRAQREARDSGPFAAWRGPATPRAGESLFSGLSRGVDERMAARQAADVSDAAEMRKLQEAHHVAERAESGQLATDKKELQALDLKIQEAKNAGDGARYNALVAEKKRIHEGKNVGLERGVELQKGRASVENNRLIAEGNALTRQLGAAAAAAQRKDARDVKTTEDENKAVKDAVAKAEDAFMKGLSAPDKLKFNHPEKGTALRKALADKKAEAEREVRRLYAEGRGGKPAPPGPGTPSEATKPSVGAPIKMPGGGTARPIQSKNIMEP